MEICSKKSHRNGKSHTHVLSIPLFFIAKHYFLWKYIVMSKACTLTTSFSIMLGQTIKRRRINKHTVVASS
jgi:hypothetical protein